MVEKLLCAAGHNLLRLDVSGKSKISLTSFMKALHPCRQLQILSIEPGTLKQDGSTCGDTKLPSIAKLVWLSSGTQDCIINSMRVVIVALPRLREVTIMLPAEGTTPDPISIKDDLITAMKHSNSSLNVSLCMV
ncbi:hypothetical protein FRC18_010943 [Serendipita sp. 400]|nr:hypothetical protein FRC18_010943 [Serendipita sp. 400]